jgi:large subunit ribosomal protein L4
MKLTIQGGAAGIEVSDRNFAAPFNEALVHQVVTAYRAAGRAGTKAQKTRAEVRGGGIKPWKQKGTGRARAGSSRSPIWVGGGRAFAAAPRRFEQKVNRKMYRAALRGVLSELVRQDRLVVVDELQLDKAKTRDLVARLKQLGLDHVLIVVEQVDQKLGLASRNLPRVEVTEARQVDPVTLIRYPKVLATAGAVRGIEGRLS